MRKELKLLLSWIVLLLLLRLALLLPHSYLDDPRLINAGLQVLVAMLCFEIFRGTIGSHRFLFLNFAFSFSFVLPSLFSSFVGESFFVGKTYAPMYYYLFINEVGMNFFTLIPLCYLFFDYLLRGKKIYLNYVLSIAVSLAVILIFFYRFIVNPFQLFDEPAYLVFDKLSTVETAYVKEFHSPPDDRWLATQLSNELSIPYNDALDKVNTTKPYLENNGSFILFWKPLEMGTVYIDGITLGIIAVLLYWFYTKNRPYHAYLDKILILLFVFNLTDAAHLYTYLTTSSREQLHALFQIGQYVTICCSLMLVYALDLKLRFAVSATGKYYESSLENSPEKITIWRDEIDNLVLKLFFKNKKDNQLAFTQKEKQ